MERVVGQYLHAFAKTLALKRRNKTAKRSPVQAFDYWPSELPQATEAEQQFLTVNS